MYTELEQSAINRSLENILSDPKFVGSPQMSAFLRYVVTETLQGNAERIKAYTVAVDALGKSEAFDPQSDPSVRVLAKRLRTSLDQYYERTRNHEMIIEIRAGSYRPIFTDPSETAGEDAGAKGILDGLSEIVNNQSAVIPTQGANSTSSFNHIEAAGAVNREAGLNESTSHVTVIASKSDSTANFASIKEVIPSAPTPKEQSGSDAKHHPQQKVGESVNVASVNVTNNGDSSALSENSWFSKAVCSVQQNKSTSIALLVMTAATLVWSLGSSPQVPEHANFVSANNQEVFELQLASANSSALTRQRPAVPTVIVKALNPEDKISKSLLSSISHVLSKFDHLQVLSPNREYELLEKWPEDYEIVVDTLVMDDSKKITVELINAASGRVAFSDDLLLNGNDGKSISKNHVTALELFIARIIQKNGPLLSDYKNQGNHSEIMACVFSIEASGFESHSDENCLDKVVTQGRSRLMQGRLRAEISLRKLANSDGSERKVALKNALNAARENLDQTPHSADAHALMMQVFHMSGDYSTALKYGNNAKDINGLDGGNLLALAVLLDEMKKSKEADEIRKQVSYLNPSIFRQTL